MKIFFFLDKQNNKKIGILYNNISYDLTKIIDYKFNHINDFINAYNLIKDNIYKKIDNDKVQPLDDKDIMQYLPPVESYNKIICVGLNYKQHVIETKKDYPKYPAFFSRFYSSLVAHQQNIMLPKISNKCDYEGELAVIIGAKAKHIKAQEAASFIFGYSIFNDVTVRDYQGKSPQWLLGKNFDNTGAIGPYILTQDSFGADIPNFDITTRLNGKIMQQDNTNNMIFPIGLLIEYITEAICLSPGDIIVTGTPAGVGYTQDPPIYLKANDLCEISISNIGALINISREY